LKDISGSRGLRERAALCQREIDEGERLGVATEERSGVRERGGKEAS